MKILTILIILAITVVIAVAVEIYRELHHFCVTDYTIRQAKLSGLSGEAVIVFLSDLHCRTYGKNNEKLVRAVTEAKPDLILIGGDMLVGKKHADCIVFERKDHPGFLLGRILLWAAGGQILRNRHCGSRLVTSSSKSRLRRLPGRAVGTLGSLRPGTGSNPVTAQP